MTRKLIVIAVISLAFLQLSCLKVNTSCDFKQCQFVAPDAEVQAVAAYIAANGLTATKHCTGLFYNISNAGSGKSPDGCSFVNLTYIGRTTGGFVFDSHSPTPVLINLNQVITGWRAALPLIKEGGSITLYIPPYLAYGAQDIKDASGNVIVPGNSILIFDIGLSSVQ